MQQRTLQPEFNQQDAALTAQEASQGILGSGAGRAGLNTLVGQQSGTLASALSPLYQEALGQYGGAQTSGAGAAADAYQSAIQQFYQGLQQVGNFAGDAFGVPGLSGGDGGGAGAQYTAIAGMPGAGGGGGGTLGGGAYNPYGSTGP